MNTKLQHEDNNGQKDKRDFEVSKRRILKDDRSMRLLLTKSIGIEPSFKTSKVPHF